MLNKHSKIPGGNIGTLFAPQNGEYVLIVLLIIIQFGNQTENDKVL